MPAILDCLNGQGGGLARGATEDLAKVQRVTPMRTSRRGNRGIYTDSLALSKCLHYILLGNLGKDTGQEFRLGMVVAASKALRMNELS